MSNIILASDLYQKIKPTEESAGLLLKRKPTISHREGGNYFNLFAGTNVSVQEPKKHDFYQSPF